MLGYMSIVESSFAIVAEPNRRAILSLLLSSERSVGEIERKLRLSQPSVSKHLRVLREAGFVESRIEAQRRLYRLRPEPLMELDAWLVPFRRFWSRHVDALEQHLKKMERSGRSFSSATSPTLRQRSGRRSRTPSIYANWLRSILTGTSVPLAPQSSRQWERRRRTSPRPR